MTLLYVNSATKKDWNNPFFHNSCIISDNRIHYPNAYLVIYSCQTFLQEQYQDDLFLSILSHLFFDWNITRHSNFIVKNKIFNGKKIKLTSL